MKKIISFLLSVSLCVSLGCADISSAKALSPQTETEQTTENLPENTTETAETSTETTKTSTETAETSTETTKTSTETTETSTETTETETETSYPFGDADKNGTVDSKDATAVLVSYAESILGKTDKAPDLALADVNSDGTADSKDATVILLYYAYKIINNTYSGDMHDFIENHLEKMLADIEEEAQKKRTEMSTKYPDLKNIAVNCASIAKKVLDIDETETEVKKILQYGSAVKYLQEFFNSPEYISRSKSADEFIKDIYSAMGVKEKSSISEKSKEALAQGVPAETIINSILSDSDFKELCTKNGLDTVVYENAASALENSKGDLMSAFKFASSMEYEENLIDVRTGTDWFADYGFKNKKGNCYVMAAVFCEMARELGYEAHQVSGVVPLRAGGLGPHSWVEIEMDGKTYVFDPDFTEETGKDGYKISYGQSGTWRYEKNCYMS